MATEWWDEYTKGIEDTWEDAKSTGNRIFVLIFADEQGADHVKGAYHSIDVTFRSYVQHLLERGYFEIEGVLSNSISAEDVPPIEYFPIDGPLNSIYLGGGGEKMLCANYDWRIEEHEVGAKA